MTPQARITEVLFTLVGSSRSAREGETALSPERNNAPPLATAKEGVRGGTSKSRAKAAAKLQVLARGEEVALPEGSANMVSPVPSSGGRI